MRQAMVPFGRRWAFRQDGRRTALAIGFGSRPGVGPGWMMSLGALLHSTMAAGPMLKAHGAGSPAPCTCARSTRPHWWYLSAATLTVTIVVSAAGRAWAGSRWPREKSTCPVIAAAGLT